MIKAATLFLGLTALASTVQAQGRNFRAQSDAYYGDGGAGVKTVVEGLGPDWEIESRTTAINRRTGQRITVSGSASPRGTQTSVNETQPNMVWLNCPIYLRNSQTGQHIGSGGWWYVAGYKRELVPEGTSRWYNRDVQYMPSSYTTLSHGPGQIRASSQYESGVVGGSYYHCRRR